MEDQLQHINSCTKSIVSALIGICLDMGLIHDIHVPIAEYFGDMLSKQGDERKKQITLEHLLTMSAGFHWPEFGEWNYFSPMGLGGQFILVAPDENMVAVFTAREYKDTMLPMRLFKDDWYEVFSD